MAGTSVDVVSRPPTDEEIPEGLIEIGTVLPLREYLRQLWGRREFILTLPLGDLRAQNQNTALGQVWHMLNPLLLAAVYYLVFGIIFPQTRIDYYAAYLVVGIITFNFTNKAMMSGTRTIINNANLIKQITFPRVALPISSALAESYSQVPALIAMMGLVFVVTRFEPPTLNWFEIVPLTVLQAFFNLGLGFVTARLTFHFRDTQQVLPFIIRLWMYLSGLFFPLRWVVDKATAHHVPWMVTVFQLNPLWLFMSLARHALVPGKTDPNGVVHRAVETPGWYWLAAGGWALVAVLAGFFYFRAGEHEYTQA